jgi:amidase
MVPMMPAPGAPAHPSRHWKEVVAEKLSADEAKIPEPWRLSPDVITAAKSRKQIAGDFVESLLDSETLQITSVDAPDLVAAMGNGSLTAVQVVTAYCKRAAFAHQLVRTKALSCVFARGAVD